MAVISHLRIHSYELSASICKTDKTQRGRFVRHHNIKYGNILTASAWNSVKPSVIIRKTSDSFGRECASRSQRFKARSYCILAFMCGSINVNFMNCLPNCC